MLESSTGTVARSTVVVRRSVAGTVPVPVPRYRYVLVPIGTAVQLDVRVLRLYGYTGTVPVTVATELLDLDSS
jgi:hypothetical protein